MKRKYEPLEINDVVLVDFGNFRNVRGTITEINNDMAVIEVHAYYGTKQKITLERDIKTLYKAK